MLSFLEQAADFALSGNQLVFKIAARDGAGQPYGATPATASLITAGEDDLQAGDTLSFSWTEANGASATFTFTFQNSPTGIFDLPAIPSSTYLEYLESIKDIILSHRLISAFFSAEVIFDNPSYRIVFTALEEVEVNLSAVFANGLTSTSLSAAVSSNLPSNYQVYIEVYFEADYESDHFERIATLKGSLDAASNVVLDLSDILHTACKENQASLPVPLFTDNTPILAPLTKRYFLRIWEDYDGIPAILTSTTIAKRILFAAIDQLSFGSGDFFNGISALSRLLGNRPDTHTIASDQPFWIAYINHTAIAKSAVLVFELQNAAGQTLRPIRFNNTSVPPYSVMLFPVGFQQNGLQNEVISDVVSYTTQLYDAVQWNMLNEQILSPSRTFYIDRAMKREVHYFFYLNNFNTPESIRCIGDLDQDLETSIQQSKQILEADYSNEAITELVFEPEFERSYTFRTGYLSQEHTLSLQKMLIDRRIYKVSLKGVTPLLITSNKFSITSTKQFLNALSFKAIRALEERHFSNTEL